MNNTVFESLDSLRKKQIESEFYRNFIYQFDKFSVLPITLRNSLIKKFDDLLSIKIIKFIFSNDKQTIKVLLERKSDNLRFESVLMKFKDGRNTVCVSSMIGCPLNCLFCATGKMGFKANLTYSEIIDQFIIWANYLKSEKERVSNIVFMGMGEPLLNFDNVINAINVFTDPKKIAYSSSRITISTAGIISGISKLSLTDYKGELAISLHSAIQQKRDIIMPISKTNLIEDLKKTLKNYQTVKPGRITLEYILLNNFNMSEEDVSELVKFSRNLNVLINLIPYNDIGLKSLKRPSTNNIFKFKKQLESYGLKVTLRYTKGDDKLAACGQLYTKN